MNKTSKQFGFSIKIYDAVNYNEKIKIQLNNGSYIKFNPTVYGTIKGNLFLQGFFWKIILKLFQI